MKYLTNIRHGIDGLRESVGLWGFLIQLDKFANAILFGDPQETISSRLGKNSSNFFAWASCHALNLIFREKDHCKDAIQKEEGSDAISDNPLIFLIIFAVIIYGMATLMGM